MNLNLSVLSHLKYSECSHLKNVLYPRIGRGEKMRLEGRMLKKKGCSCWVALKKKKIQYSQKLVLFWGGICNFNRSTNFVLGFHPFFNHISVQILADVRSADDTIACSAGKVDAFMQAFDCRLHTCTARPERIAENVEARAKPSHRPRDEEPDQEPKNLLHNLRHFVCVKKWKGRSLVREN